MKITRSISHILQHDLSEVLGYLQQFVEVSTDEGITGWQKRCGALDVGHRLEELDAYWFEGASLHEDNEKGC